MKRSILFLSIITVTIAFSSCSTAYKTGQTPDDVYFSSAAPHDEYVRVNSYQDDQKYYGDDYYDNRYLRMKVRNPHLWSPLNDWYYYGDRYNYGYSYYNNYDLYLGYNPWNSYSYWNNYYNPYYYNYVVINPKITNTYTAPRTTNLNTFNSRKLLEPNINNSKTTRKFNTTYRNNSSGNSERNTGSLLRNIFNRDNSSGNSGNTSSRSSESNSSGSSKSNSSAPVRKF
ncbi:MAG: hypothetical protein JST10_10585 [Bacteroidetes bacterium]|nr:hypothetical protein [Bacteroidota bacterium]